MAQAITIDHPLPWAIPCIILHKTQQSVYLKNVSNEPLPFYENVSETLFAEL